MTYTVIARCPRTGRVGIGIATYSITVGRYCTGVKANTGVTITQAFPREGNNYLALNLLGQGCSAARVLEELCADDPDYDWRQIGIVDREGNAVAHTGPGVRGWCGHETGPGWVAFGNGLMGPEVVTAIASGFNADPEADLEERLLRGIEAGRDAGGQGTRQRPKTERSAALIVYSDFDYCDIDLRVDLHERAVDELRRAYAVYQPYRAYYRDRGKNPKDAVPQDVFVASLEAAQGTQTGAKVQA